MSEHASWSVLVVDDDEGQLSDIQRDLPEIRLGDDRAVAVVVTQTFADAVPILKSRRIDLVVLDVSASPGADPDEAGRAVYEDIRAHIFAPVIFFTGFPDRVRDLAHPPLVDVVAKISGVEALAEALARAVASNLPTLVAGLDEHVRSVTRDYLWSAVGPDWNALSDAAPADVAALLVQRLARSLEATRMDTLQGPLASLAAPAAHPWHPAQMYVVPPLQPRHDTGDIVRNESDGRQAVVLTPACDLEQNKADFVVMAGAIPLRTHVAFRTWNESRSQSNRGKLRDVISGKNERYFYLPGLLHYFGDLIVDLQQLEHVPVTDLDRWTVSASLALPYAQVLSGRFVRYLGRLGYEDVPADKIIDRLEAEQTSGSD